MAGQMSAELCRRVKMESNRNIDSVTERYVVTLEQGDAEHSRSRRRRNDETTERADSRRSAQRERKQQRRRYLETVEQWMWLGRPMLGVLLIAVGLNVVHGRNFAEYVGRLVVVINGSTFLFNN